MEFGTYCIFSKKADAWVIIYKISYAQIFQM